MKTIMPVIQKRNVGLSKFIPDTGNLFFRWMNDPEVYRFLGDRDPSSFSEKETIECTRDMYYDKGEHHD